MLIRAYNLCQNNALSKGIPKKNSQTLFRAANVKHKAKGICANSPISFRSDMNIHPKVKTAIEVRKNTISPTV